MSEQNESKYSVDLERLKEDIILTSKLISLQMERVQQLLNDYECLPNNKSEIDAKLKEIRRDSLRLERMMETMYRKQWWRV